MKFCIAAFIVMLSLPSLSGRRTQAVHFRLAARRDRAQAARRDDARRAGDAGRGARRSVAAAERAGPERARARPAGDPRDGGPVPRELRLPGGGALRPGAQARRALPELGHRVRVRRRGPAGLHRPAAHPGDAHASSKGGKIERADGGAPLAPGMALRGAIAARLRGREHVGAARGAGGGAPRRLDPERAPGRRFAALRGARALAARARRVDLDQRRDLAAAAAPRIQRAQGLRRAGRHQPPHHHADRLGAGGKQPQAESMRKSGTWPGSTASRATSASGTTTSARARSTTSAPSRSGPRCAPPGASSRRRAGASACARRSTRGSFSCRSSSTPTSSPKARPSTATTRAPSSGARCRTRYLK